MGEGNAPVSPELPWEWSIGLDMALDRWRRSMKVVNEIMVYEVNGKAAKDHERVLIESCWTGSIESRKVVLRIGDQAYTVGAEDVRRAMDNALNTTPLG